MNAMPTMPAETQKRHTTHIVNQRTKKKTKEGVPSIEVNGGGASEGARGSVLSRPPPRQQVGIANS